MNAISVRLEKSGRILIPAALRRKLGLRAGAEVLLSISKGGVQMRTRDQVLDDVQRKLSKYAPNRLLSEELIADRRREAEQETAE